MINILRATQEKTGRPAPLVLLALTDAAVGLMNGDTPVPCIALPPEAAREVARRLLGYAAEIEFEIETEQKKAQQPSAPTE